MNARATAVLLIGVAIAPAPPALAQAPRTDAIWARSTAGAVITLDGNLNEPAWAAAESWKVHYRYNNGIPGSGWKDEGGFPPTLPTNDSTNATLKFLVAGNQLYLGATVPDKSIGGGGGFNYFDGFLMGLKDHSSTQGFPKPVMEYLYSWWYPRQSDLASPCAQSIDSAVGNPPIFKGRWAPDPVCEPDGPVKIRTANQIAQWDARTVVDGLTNSDATTDVGYTVEMRFNLDSLGYHVDQAQGDIIEWNLSIYDTDNWWKSPLGFDLSRNRTWWQSPWGLIAEQDEVHIYARPDVTINSGPVPVIPPELTIPNRNSAVAPVIDGLLTDAVWGTAPSFNIKWGDNALRATYPGVGPYRSGQYQPRLSVNAPAPAALPFVWDGGDATVRYFNKDDLLYLAFDVRDQYVQYYPVFDRYDGFLVSITDRAALDPEDHNLQGRALTFQVGPTGQALAQGYLPTLISTGGAQVALALKPGTTIDTVGSSTDTGYTAELAVDLKQLGYPAGLGDRTLFLGINLLDGDSFNDPVSDSYTTQTWWFREREEQCCPVWAYLEPATTGVGDQGPRGSGVLSGVANRPNPFRLFTLLRFSLGRESDVSLRVYDIQGRQVLARSFGRLMAGDHELPVRLPGWKAGVYLYRVEVRDAGTRELVSALDGKMMLLR
jgi:hypothetical protein